MLCFVMSERSALDFKRKLCNLEKVIVSPDLRANKNNNNKTLPLSHLIKNPFLNLQEIGL